MAHGGGAERSRCAVVVFVAEAHRPCGRAVSPGRPGDTAPGPASARRPWGPSTLALQVGTPTLKRGRVDDRRSGFHVGQQTWRSLLGLSNRADTTTIYGARELSGRFAVNLGRRVNSCCVRGFSVMYSSQASPGDLRWVLEGCSVPLLEDARSDIGGRSAGGRATTRRLELNGTSAAR